MFIIYQQQKIKINLKLLKYIHIWRNLAYDINLRYTSQKLNPTHLHIRFRIRIDVDDASSSKKRAKGDTI
jgi:hypothetical protein